jgi:hypothetical protein
VFIDAHDPLSIQAGRIGGRDHLGGLQAMVLTVFQDRPSLRATAATVMRSNINRRGM